MTSDRRRIYWDSSVWLSYINGYPEYLPTLEALLADSANRLGDIELCTSVVSQVEVAFALVEQTRQTPDPEIEEAIDALWASRPTITLIEYTEAIGREARDLIRMGLEHSWQLKPIDAIHLSSARWHQVTELHTYDKRLQRYSNQVGFPILDPYIAGGPTATQPKLGLDDPH